MSCLLAIGIPERLSGPRRSRAFLSRRASRRWLQGQVLRRFRSRSGWLSMRRSSICRLLVGGLRTCRRTCVGAGPTWAVRVLDQARRRGSGFWSFSEGCPTSRAWSRCSTGRSRSARSRRSLGSRSGWASFRFCRTRWTLGSSWMCSSDTWTVSTVGCGRLIKSRCEIQCETPAGQRSPEPGCVIV
jgi:hypothetical protein